MQRVFKTFAIVTSILLLITVQACTKNEITSPEEESATLIMVFPSGGSINVDPDTSVVIEFDHPIHETMIQYAAVHEGDINGPVVPGIWTLSDDGMKLIFTPSEPFKPATTYTVHLGGGMTDDHGHNVDIHTHGEAFGGTWATGGTMGHGGMMGNHEHMGQGWQHENGSYGMIFTFTTAG